MNEYRIKKPPRLNLKLLPAKSSQQMKTKRKDIFWHASTIHACLVCPPFLEMSMMESIGGEIGEELKYDAQSALIRNDAPSSAFVPIAPSTTSNCAICCEQLSSQVSVQISKCRHVFHQSCIEGCLQKELKCPLCRAPLGEPKGKCPSGTMTIKSKPKPCPGFSTSTTCITITYDIPSGTQNACHDNPGCEYKGTKRKAFIPNNQEGRQLLARLKYAFMRGLTFTVGQSMTTGQKNVVTWTSIPHKTSLKGGLHGFPDSNYISNCNSSLDALNVPCFSDSLFHTSPPFQLLPVPNEKDLEGETVRYDAPLTLASSKALNSVLQPLPPHTLAEECPICLETLSDVPVARIKSCVHVFHDSCIRGCLEKDSACPLCRAHVGESQGGSPSGTMTIHCTNDICPGFSGAKTIEMTYHIPGGIQRPYHEDPGQPYNETTRVAYLPNNNEGRALSSRFKYAFSRGLTFMVGTSLTTGQKGAVVWSQSIPHKTSLIRGPFGFPDEDYIRKCNQALDKLHVPRTECFYPHLCPTAPLEDNDLSRFPQKHGQLPQVQQSPQTPSAPIAPADLATGFTQNSCHQQCSQPVQGHAISPVLYKSKTTCSSSILSVSDASTSIVLMSKDDINLDPVNKFRGFLCTQCGASLVSSDKQTCQICLSVAGALAPVLSGITHLRRQSESSFAVLQALHSKLDTALRMLAHLDNRLNNPIPRLFILVPAEPKKGRRHARSWLRSKFVNKYHLYFICAHSHRAVLSPVKVSISRPWVEKIAPVLGASLVLLQMSLKVGTGIELDLRDAFSNLMEIGADKIGEMLEEVETFLDKTDGNTVVDRLRNQQLGPKDINELNGDAFETVMDKAREQQGWRSEMEPVRVHGDTRTLWVSRNIAQDPRNGYTILNG